MQLKENLVDKFNTLSDLKVNFVEERRPFLVVVIFYNYRKLAIQR
jgi:hypothetical protein